MNTIPAATLIKWAETLTEAIKQAELHRRCISGSLEWYDAHANHETLIYMKAELMRACVTDVAVEGETG